VIGQWATAEKLICAACMWCVSAPGIFASTAERILKLDLRKLSNVEAREAASTAVGSAKEGAGADDLTGSSACAWGIE